jgi:dienelactone hydrolase
MDEIRSHPDPYAAVQAQQDANDDVFAALKWLRAPKQVDPNRLMVSGCSFGGIQTLLTAEKGLGARGFIAFAPAARSWGNPGLEQMLGDAVRMAKGSVFILQARHDFSIQPAQVLGKIAKAKGGQATIYPRFGETHEDGHWKFATTQAGIAIWGEHVLNFINERVDASKPHFSPTPERYSWPTPVSNCEPNERKHHRPILDDEDILLVHRGSSD